MGIQRIAAVLVLVAGLGGASLVGWSPATAAPLPASPARAAPLASPTQAAAPSQPRWERETVAFGARDVSPYQISHVYEVQIRLTATGTYRGAITGYFGVATRAAVQRFQRSQRLPATGVVNQATWSRLIWYSTLRSPGWARLPAVCRSAGWHTCYSRSSHELFALKNGTLWNSWLVRGGAYSLQTVLGTYRVYWRDLHHRSHQYHNAPMPYSQFFYDGEAVHGSATMMDPRVGHSAGCINMYIEDAAVLWRLTDGSSNVVTVYGPWR